jgi:hypothetical protein
VRVFRVLHHADMDPGTIQLCEAIGDSPPAAEAPRFAMAPRVIALVAMDWTAGDRRRGGARFAEIAVACDEAGCDTLLYALGRHSERQDGALTEQELFGEGPSHLRWVVVETERETTGANPTQVWQRGHSEPQVLFQRLAESSDCRGKSALIRDLQGRRFDSTLVLIDSEISIIETTRGKADVIDDYGFLGTLGGIQTILNPGHSYMVRHEMRKKRVALSLGGRRVVSVWNRGCHDNVREAREPWQVLRNGQDATEQVTELAHSLGPNLRIGVLPMDGGGDSDTEVTR